MFDVFFFEKEFDRANARSGIALVYHWFLMSDVPVGYFQTQSIYMRYSS